MFEHVYDYSMSYGAGRELTTGVSGGAVVGGGAAASLSRVAVTSQRALSSSAVRSVIVRPGSFLPQVVELDQFGLHTNTRSFLMCIV